MAVGAGVGGEDRLHVRVRAGDHVDRHELADAARRGGPGVGGGLHGADLPADHHGGDVAAADYLLADQLDAGRLDHGVGGLDGAYEAAGLDEAEGDLAHGCSVLP